MLGYELQKISFQKIGLILIIVLWVLAQYLFYQELDETRIIQGYQTEWETVNKETDEKTYEETLEWLIGEYDHLMEDIFSLYGETYRYWRVIMHEMEKYKYLIEYPEYIQNVLAQAEAMENSPIFKAKGSFVIDNMRKTKSAFEELTKVEISGETPECLADVLSDKVGMVLLIVQTVVLAMCVFGPEQDPEKKMLLTMQYRGRIPVAAAKIVCVVIGSLFFACLMYGGFLVQAGLAMGERDWSAPIQSLQEMKRCTWNVSCSQFLLLFLFNKILATVLIGMLASVCICLLKSTGGMLLFGGIMLLSIAVRSYLPETVEWLWIKNINLIVWADTWEWMHQYMNIAVFGHAVSRGVCFYLGMACGIPACTISVAVLFPKDWQPKRPASIAMQKMINRITAGLTRTTSFASHHGYQMFLYGMRYLLLPVAILGIYAAANLRGDQGYYYLEKATYESYMNTVGGVYTEETEEFLEQEEAHLYGMDGYTEAVAADLKAGKITQKEYENLLYELEKEQKQKMDGFLLVSQQWSLIKNVEQSGEGEAGFFQKYLAEELFEISNKGYMLLGIMFLVIILFIAPYSRIESACDDLMMTACKGRTKRLVVRLLFNMLVALMSGMGIYLAWYFVIFTSYPEQNYNLSAACLQKFSQLDPNTTIRQVIIVSGIAKVVGLMLLAVVVTILSVKKLDHVSYYVVMAAVIVIPMILGILRVPVQRFSLMGFFQMEEIISRSLWEGVGYMVIWTVASIAFLLYTVRCTQHFGEGIEQKRR